MPTQNDRPLLAFRVDRQFHDRLDRYWRLHTRHRHLSDAARALLEEALERAERATEQPHAADQREG